MTEPEGMDELRERLRRAENDARAARYLAGGADRDTAEIRAELREFRAETRAEFADVRAEMRTFRDQNNRVLNAMRADMTDGFAEMREGFRVIDDKFVEIRGILDGQAAWNQRLAGMLNVLIHRQGDDPADRS